MARLSQVLLMLSKAGPGLKVVLAPNQTLARLWAKRFASLKLRFTTIKALAFSWVKQSQQKLPTLLSRFEANLLVLKLLREQIAEKKRSYLGKLAWSASTYAAFTNTLRAFRQSGILAEELDPATFSHPDKGEQLIAVLGSYENLLKEKFYCDYADVLKAARSWVLDQPVESVSTTYFKPAETLLSGLELSLWDQIPEASKFLPEIEEEDEPPTITDYVAQIARKHSILIQRAFGPCSEVRYILRHCLRNRIPFDQVEVIYPDGSNYPNLFTEELELAAVANQQTIPLSRQKAIALETSNFGQLLTAWLHLVETGLERSALLQLLQTPGLVWPTINLKPAQVLEVISRWPLERGIKRTQEILAFFAEEFDHAPTLFDNQESEEASTITQEQELQRVVRWLQNWLAPFTSEKPTAEELLEATKRFAGTTSNHLTKWLDAASNLLKNKLELSASDLLTALQLALQEEPSEGQLPTPGAIHLVPLSQASWSNRKYSFLLGMSEENFRSEIGPGHLLTSKEKREIAPELGQVLSAPNTVEAALLHCISRTDGHVVCLYSHADPLDQRERFPSSSLLRIQRAARNEPEMDLTQFEASLPYPEIGIALSGSQPLYPHETISLAFESSLSGDKLIQANYPWLLEGKKASLARSGTFCSPYDGVLKLSPKINLADQPYQVKQWEALAQCALRFFYDAVLNIRLPSKETIGLISGILLHDIFQSFYSRLTAKEKPVQVERDIPRLMDLLKEKLREKEKNLPPIPPSERLRLLQEMEYAIRIFVMEEANWSQYGDPIAFEIPSSRVADGDLVTLPSGKTIRAKARLDRIDKLHLSDSPMYCVWDYKTGSSSNFTEKRSLDEYLQPYLYIQLARKYLKTKIDPNANVYGFGYFFPGVKGQGDRVTFREEEVRESGERLDHLRGIVANGFFLATIDSKKCQYCAFNSTCKVGEANAQARIKLDSLHYGEGNQ